MTGRAGAWGVYVWGGWKINGGDVDGGTCDSLGGPKTDFLSEPGNLALINDYLVTTAFLAISKSSAVN
jgi:hypothetical protein